MAFGTTELGRYCGQNNVSEAIGRINHKMHMNISIIEMGKKKLFFMVNTYWRNAHICIFCMINVTEYFRS